MYLRISIVIPFPLYGTAQTALHSLKKIKYPHHLLEIITVQGNQPARQRNMGIKKAHGDIIYLLDNDSQVRSTALNIINRHFIKNKKLVVLGGPSLLPQKSKVSYLNRLIGYALETYFGALRMRYRYSSQTNRKANEYHLIGANLAIRKNVFTRFKGFDEAFYPNEETDFLRRLYRQGYEMNYVKELFVYREHRKNLLALMRQFYRYGKGRMMQIKKCPTAEDIIFAIPITFGFYLLSILYFHPLWYLLPICFYIFGGLATSVKAATKHHKLDVLITLPLIFPFIHLSYGLGLLNEALKWSHKKVPVIIKVKRINTTSFFEPALHS